MSLLLKRKPSTEKATIGELYAPDGGFVCHTLEDVIRDHKEAGATCIPAGEYEVIINWSNRYQRLMPRLLAVPFYTGVLIHPGNVAAHTHGCILVGRWDANLPDFVGHSRDTFDVVFTMIRKMGEKGKVFLKIEGGFEAKDWKVVPSAI